MGRRTALLIAAVIVAALGTTLIFVYVNGVDDRAIADQQPMEVLVAKDTIPVGTSVADIAGKGGLQLKRLPRLAVVPGALSNTTTITGEQAVAPIQAGEQILVSQFAKPGTASGLSLPEGKLALSIQLGDPARVAGFVQPGSNVAIFMTTTSGQSNNSSDFTRVLLPKLTVVAVGPTTAAPQRSSSGGSAANPESLPRALLTVAADQTEAQKLIYAQSKGQLYFALLTDKSTVTPGPGVNLGNLFG